MAAGSKLDLEIDVGYVKDLVNKRKSICLVIDTVEI